MTGYSKEKTKVENQLKALILAGGRGKRLNTATEEQNKCMLKFGDKHLIEYSLSKVAELGIAEAVIVVGHLAEQIINHFGTSYQGVIIKYAIQREQRGLVHAIECSKPFIGTADFLLFLGDEFFLKTSHKRLIDMFYKEDAFAVCGVIQTNDSSQIRKTYSILFDERSKRVLRLVEKPTVPLNNLMGTGNIIFKNNIYDYIPKTPINQQRGERELPDLIQCAVDDGNKVLYYVISSTYMNVNTPEDVTIIKEVLKEGESSKDSSGDSCLQ